jgi:hypothetical protein
MQDVSGGWPGHSHQSLGKLLEALWNTQVTLNFLDHEAAVKDNTSDMMKVKVCQWEQTFHWI